MKKISILIVAIIAILLFINLDKKYRHNQKISDSTIVKTSEINKQQVIIDCYLDSCNFCSESKLKYYYDMLEIQYQILDSMKKPILK